MTANIAIADSLKALDFNRPNREEPLIACLRPVARIPSVHPRKRLDLGDKAQTSLLKFFLQQRRLATFRVKAVTSSKITISSGLNGQGISMFVPPAFVEEWTAVGEGEQARHS